MQRVLDLSSTQRQNSKSDSLAVDQNCCRRSPVKLVVRDGRMRSVVSRPDTTKVMGKRRERSRVVHRVAGVKIGGATDNGIVVAGKESAAIVQKIGGEMSVLPPPEWKSYFGGVFVPGLDYSMLIGANASGDAGKTTAGIHVMTPPVVSESIGREDAELEPGEIVNSFRNLPVIKTARKRKCKSRKSSSCRSSQIRRRRSTPSIPAQDGNYVINDRRSPTSGNDYLRPTSSDDGDVVLEVECGANRGYLYLSRLCQGSRGPCIECHGAWLTPNEFQYVSGRETAKDWKRSIRHRGKSIKLLLAKGVLAIHRPDCGCDGCRSRPPLMPEREPTSKSHFASPESPTRPAQTDGTTVAASGDGVGDLRLSSGDIRLPAPATDCRREMDSCKKKLEQEHSPEPEKKRENRLTSIIDQLISNKARGLGETVVSAPGGESPKLYPINDSRQAEGNGTTNVFDFGPDDYAEERREREDDAPHHRRRKKKRHHHHRRRFNQQHQYNDERNTEPSGACAVEPTEHAPPFPTTTSAVPASPLPPTSLASSAVKSHHRRPPNELTAPHHSADSRSTPLTRPISPRGIDAPISALCAPPARDSTTTTISRDGPVAMPADTLVAVDPAKIKSERLSPPSSHHHHHNHHLLFDSSGSSGGSPSGSPRRSSASSSASARLAAARLASAAVAAFPCGGNGTPPPINPRSPAPTATTPGPTTPTPGGGAFDRFSPASSFGSVAGGGAGTPGTPILKQMEQMMTRNYSDFMRSLAAKYNNSNPADGYGYPQVNGFMRNFDGRFPFKTATPPLMTSLGAGGAAAINNGNSHHHHHHHGSKDDILRKSDNNSAPPVLAEHRHHGNHHNNNNNNSLGPGPLSVVDLSSTHALITMMRNATAASQSQLENYLRGSVKRPAGETEGGRTCPLDLTVGSGGKRLRTDADHHHLLRQGGGKSMRDFRDMFGSLRAKCGGGTNGGDSDGSDVSSDAAASPKSASLVNHRLWSTAALSEAGAGGGRQSRLSDSPGAQHQQQQHHHRSGKGASEAAAAVAATRAALMQQQPCLSACVDGACSDDSEAAVVAAWNVDDVCGFVASIDICVDYVETFREQSIDGAALPLLTEEHLINNMNMKLGPALKFRATLAKKIGHCSVCMHCIHCHRSDASASSASSPNDKRSDST